MFTILYLWTNDSLQSTATAQVGAQVNNTVALYHILLFILLAIFSAFYSFRLTEF